MRHGAQRPHPYAPGFCFFVGSVYGGSLRWRWEGWASKPVSRILYPAEAGGDHSSRPGIAAGLKQPTRESLCPDFRCTENRGRIAERAAPPLLFGLAPRGVCLAAGITACAVRSYFKVADATRTFSPLPRVVAPVSPPASFGAADSAASGTRWYIFCGTFRTGDVRPTSRNPSPALAVSEHTALWSSDFPLLCFIELPRQSSQHSSDRPAYSPRFYDSKVSISLPNASARVSRGLPIGKPRP
jgi:hypothetical protein